MWIHMLEGVIQLKTIDNMHSNCIVQHFKILAICTPSRNKKTGVLSLTECLLHLDVFEPENVSVRSSHPAQTNVLSTVPPRSFSANKDVLKLPLQFGVAQIEVLLTWSIKTSICEVSPTKAALPIPGIWAVNLLEWVSNWIFSPFCRWSYKFSICLFAITIVHNFTIQTFPEY